MAWWITFRAFRASSAFGNYSLPTCFNCPFEQGVGGLEGCIGLPACSQHLVSLGLAWAERGMGALYI